MTKLRSNLDFLPILILMIGFGAMLITILSFRDMSLGEGDMFEVVQENQIADVVSRVLTTCILTLCGLKILSVILQAKIPSGGSGILFYFWAYFFCATFLTAIFGQHGSLNIQLFYVPIVLTAVYITRPMPSAHLLILSKFILLIYMYGSLLATVIAPSWALMGAYESLLPDVDTRLFGVSIHANQLGPLAAAYLAMELLNPTYTKLRIIHLVSAVIVLIWAQSKTAWGFSLLAGFYFLLIKIEHVFFPKSNVINNFVKLILFAFAVFLCVVVLAMTLGLSNIVSANTAVGDEVFTGRGVIWLITLNAWSENVVFGYGLDLWDIDFRTQYGLFNVGHAHSQFIHTLGSSGLIGLFGLLIYLGALTSRALKIVHVSPAALALLSLIVVDCVTETPLRNTGILNAYFFLHLLLFVQLRSVK